MQLNQLMTGGRRRLRATRHGSLELVDVGEHLRHGDVERGGHFVAELDAAIQRARQRRRRNQRHAVFGGDFADARREQIRTLGHHHRRAVARFVVAQRHGEVRGVGDHHVGLRHFLHHAAARQRALRLADAATRFR